MNIYLLLKSLHIISFIAWMAGLFYLPRLFVYHAQSGYESGAHETFLVMERKLLNIIMRPAMLATFLFGTLLILHLGFENYGKWLHVKITLVVVLAAFQAFLGRCYKKFLKKENKHSHVFFRFANEIPTVIMIIVVILAVFKPF